MNICVIGTGYVGLVTGTCLSEFGHMVTCVDTDEVKIQRIKNGDMPIYEPGLDGLVAKNVKEKRLFFTTDVADAVPNADVVFIAVGTPTSRRGDGYADLSYVYDAARAIAPHLRDYTVVVNKSTVPVGTARRVCEIITQHITGATFDMVSNPEFLREGAAIKDFTHPDRIIIGIETPMAERVMRKVYAPINLTAVPLLVVDIETAELTKYAANAFLALKISFINEMAQLSERVGANVVELARGIGMDGRIGSKFLHPGPGYGGSCFPKDTRALMATAQEQGIILRTVEAAVEANNAQRALMIKKIRDAVGGDECGMTIAVLGLAYKPETDDMRDAPALTIIPALVEHGAIIRVHDPQAMDEAKKMLPVEVHYCDDPYHACSGADVIVLMTEWNQYRALDLAYVKEHTAPDCVFVDLRNVYVPEEVRSHDFLYVGVGRQ